MRVDSWIKTSTNKLKSSDMLTARLDCLVLLEDVTKKDRAWLLAHPEHELTPAQLKKLNSQIARRAKHEPLAYIRGRSEFYGHEFVVNNHTLEPRPETETMIDLLKTVVGSQLQQLHGAQGADEQRTEPYPQYGEGAAETATQRSGKSTSRVTGSAGQQAGAVLTIVDVGTGSGCLAITAKLEMPKADVMATDISAECLKVARQNARKLGAKIRFYQGSLLEPLSKISGTRALLANLPYVPDGHPINQAATYEPRLAIFGGLDGLDLYRELFSQTKATKYVLTESLPTQHKTLAQIAQKRGYELTRAKDFIQVFTK